MQLADKLDWKGLERIYTCVKAVSRERLFLKRLVKRQMPFF
jgi:hypothetical protein